MATEQAINSMAYRNYQNMTSASLLDMPLSLVRPGTEVLIHSIKGKEETKHFLGSLGFVENSVVTVITELGGNVIVNVKGTRVAISKSMASRIYAQ